MKSFRKYFQSLILSLILLNILWGIAGRLMNMKYDLMGFPALSLIFFIINSLFILVYFKGQLRKPAEEMMHALISLSLKFLLELITAFLWFIIMKKNSVADILLFFMLYLAFSIISIFIILKSLKNKNLRT